MSETTSNSLTEKNSVEGEEATNRDVTHSPTSDANPNSTIDNSSRPAENSINQSQQTNQSEADLIEEMQNFDNLLKMLSVYRDNPDLRGNPDDRHIEEIAKVLSNFIGDDPDNFLRDSDEEEDEAVAQMNGGRKEEPNNTSDSKQEIALPVDENNIPAQAR